MSVWQNQTERALTFELRGKQHQVERDEHFMCEDRFDYAIELMGVPMTRVDGAPPVKRAPSSLSEAIVAMLDGRTVTLDGLAPGDAAVFSRLESAFEPVAGMAAANAAMQAELEVREARICALEADLAAAHDLLAAAEPKGDQPPAEPPPAEPEAAPAETKKKGK